MLIHCMAYANLLHGEDIGADMNQKIRELFCQTDYQNMLSRIAFQCAPVIAGLKVSNLLTMPSTEDTRVEKELTGTGLSYLKLGQDRGRSSFIVYREKELEKWLLKRSNQLYLKESGLAGCCLDGVLTKISIRYQHYVKKQGQYPHEIGILLGYPAEDVKGFVVNKGRNCLGSGYWKIYSNPAEKKRLFQEFDKARIQIMELLSKFLRNVQS